MITTLAATTLAAAGPYWHGGGAPMHGFPVFPVVLLLLVVGAVVFGALRRGTGRAIADARSVLADRFARGDIDAEEYRARRSELNRK